MLVKMIIIIMTNLRVEPTAYQLTTQKINELKKKSWQKYYKYKYNGSDYGGDVADDDGAACEGQ